MTSERNTESERNRGVSGVDFSKIAKDFGIRRDQLEAAVEGAAMVLRASRENIRPANKKALRGLAMTLTSTIDRVLDNAVRERLVDAVVQNPDDSNEDGLGYYIAWRAAGDRVDRAIEGARDLLALVRAGEAHKIRSGRPGYEHWTIAIGSLLEFWTRDLEREVTISDHPSDDRGVKPSPAVRFVHQCLRLTGEEITEQACRTIMQNLRDQKNESSRTVR